MDDIVIQAMAKWPNVPHCFGWLALDKRGVWRMRDALAQQHNLPGDPIRNTSLTSFINRNYTSDDQGNWYFQNGPQRVYVNLEATPYIARTDPGQTFVAHTQVPMGKITHAWLTDVGALILQSSEHIAQLDDRDLAQCLPSFQLNGKPIDDEQLLAWLSEKMTGSLSLHTQDQDGSSYSVNIARLAEEEIASHFGFNPIPQASENLKQQKN